MGHNIYQSLKQIPSPEGQNFMLYAYIPGTKSPQDDDPMMIVLGSYPNREMAEKRKAQIIRMTDHRSILIQESGEWSDLPGKIPSVLSRVPTETEHPEIGR